MKTKGIVPPHDETLENALETFYKSKIDFLYLPEIKKVILK